MKTEQVQIRKCTVNDVEAIVELGIHTFRDTFQEVNTEKDMDLYVNNTFTPAKIKEELEDKDSLFFLAEESGDIVGYAKVKTIAKPDGAEGTVALEIERLYAVKRAIGKGVGRLLMETCLEHARKLGCDVVILGVWEHNQRAISFYSKWGFQKFSQHVFMLGTDAQIDILMQKKI